MLARLLLMLTLRASYTNALSEEVEMRKFGLSRLGAAGLMAPPIGDPRRATKRKGTMMRMMTKSLMAGALVSLATVAVTGGAHAAPCPAGGAVGSTLDAYIALGAT